MQEYQLINLCNILTNSETNESMNWKDILYNSRAQNVSAAIYYTLKNNLFLKDKIPTDVLCEFENDYNTQLLVNLKLKSELISLIKIFEQNNIPIIILKGLHLSNFIYENLGMRFFRDIDIVVPINKSKEANKLAVERGYISSQNPSEIDFSFEYCHHLPEMNKNSTVLEIHGLIHCPSNDYNVPIDYIWKNLEDHKINNYNVKTLNNLILILHLVIHISYHGNFAIDLRHYYDIYIVIQKFKNDIDWKELINLSDEFKVKKGLFVVLKVIEKIFDYDFPKDFFEAMNINVELQIIDIAISIMCNYSRNSEDKELYYNYKRMYTYGNFIDLSFKQKLVKVFIKVFSSKKKLIYLFGNEYSSKPIALYSKNIFSIFSKNKSLFNNKKANKDFLKLCKESNKLNNWILE